MQTYSVNDLPMNNFSDFRDLMQRLTRTPDDIKMRIENIGFIPEPGTRHGFTIHTIQILKFLCPDNGA